MKDSISQTWVIQLVFAFVILFIGFLCLMISYTQTIKTKNQVVSIIEKYDGVTKKSVEIVNNYITAAKYKGTGSCPSDYTPIKKDGASAASWCVKALKYNSKVRYKVILFYVFDLPIINMDVAQMGHLVSFEVSGQTIDMSLKYLNKEVQVKTEMGA